MSGRTVPFLSANAILGALPESEIQRLKPYFRFVPMLAGQRLMSAQEPLEHLYFPIEGVVSSLLQLPSGEAVEVGIVGTDGVLGLPLALGGTAAVSLHRVQVHGMAAVIGAPEFQEHVRAAQSPLQNALLIYANIQLHLLAQLAACHCLHRIEQRLSRCILTLQDRIAENAFVQITHDTLAEFLGVHRPSITYALQGLAASGAITLERRRIVVNDRSILEARSCECYAIIRDLREREFRRIRKVARA